MKRFIFLLISINLLSCEQENDLSADHLLQEMETISESIDELVSISCEKANQCKAAPIGAKACGGPTNYIIYSSSTDEVELNLLIGQYTELNEKYNKLTGAISDCSIVNLPTLDCISGNCEEVQE